MPTYTSTFRASLAAALSLAAAAQAQDTPPSSGSRLVTTNAAVTEPGAAATSEANPKAPEILRITLQDAQMKAAGNGKMAELARLNVEAARHHRLAAQADYFPKIGATGFNLHYNKFMGEQLAIALPSHLGTASIPLLNKDESLFAVTVTQPVTPLFKVYQGVQVAKADERIAQSKVDAAAGQSASNVQQAYLRLLIAQRQKSAADLKVRIAANTVQLVSQSPATAQRTAAAIEAAKALATADSQVIELTQALNSLMGLPLDTQLELAPPPPPPMVETVSSGPVPQQLVDQNPEVVEARETVVKARAAANLAKLGYVPDVAGMWGYAYQTVIPALPRDFSFVGFVASWNVFDFGKREELIKEANAHVKMAEGSLELVRAKVAAGVSKSSLELQRTRRILQLTQQVAGLYAFTLASTQGSNLEMRAARAQADAEMFQAELDYLNAYADLKHGLGEK